MSDVFISYSQRFPEPTEALASDLAQAGYATWFDTRLLPNEVFWRVIMKRITDAKAVVVIWSPAAVQSEWVYSEAMLAREQKKLVCVRTDDVSPGNVPLPFNGYNVSLVTDRARIYDALAQLQVARGAPTAPLVTTATTATPLIAAAEREAGEIALAWASIKDSDDAEDFAHFLADYGQEHAFFARLADKRMRALGGGAVPVRGPATVVALPAPSKAAEAEIEAAADSVTLRIEAGMHTAPIKRISLTSDGRLMATASDDKTVRLWALPEGRLVRVLRPPIGPGVEGKVYAVAMAPNGSWVANGGWTQSGGKHFVSIFDAPTGAIRARLGPLPNVIHDLEISPDGSRLAAGLGGDNGIRVWSTDTWRLSFEDRDYSGRVFGLAFAGDGRLATTSYDGHIRLYEANGRLTSKVKAPGGERPFGIAISPDMARLAVGYDDSTRVDVLDAGTGASLYAADTSGIDNGDLSKAAWLSDGRLAAAGRYQTAGGYPVLIWANGGRGARGLWQGAKNTIMDLTPWAGGLAFGAGDPALGLLQASGAKTLVRGSPMADLRDKLGEHFLVSVDGLQVRFGLQPRSRQPHLLDLGALSLLPSPAAPAGMHQADAKALAIDGWLNTTSPKLKSKGWFGSRETPLSLETHEMARSLAIAPDVQSFVLGTDWSLRRFDAAGKQLWEQPVPGTVWGVNLARDGRLIIAAYADGTIRWHRASDGAELLACFIHLPEGPDGPKHWVLWSPAGHYTASPGGHDLVGWHVNRGPGEAAEFYPADKFRQTFHKPDIIARALDAADA